MITFLFLDLDDTILDFQKSESVAVAKALQEAGIKVTDHIISRYSEINKLHWKRLERGEITREEVLVSRFAMLFRELGIEYDAARFARNYEYLLGCGHFFLPGADEAVEQLRKDYRLFLVSNGIKSVQTRRLASAKLTDSFEKIFISQEIGFEKPSVHFFEKVFADIPGFDRTKAMIVGDSLTSDMQGGNNAGIKTCWVNPKHHPCDTSVFVDYEITSISELGELVKSI